MVSALDCSLQEGFGIDVTEETLERQKENSECPWLF